LLCGAPAGTVHVYAGLYVFIHVTSVNSDAVYQINSYNMYIHTHAYTHTHMHTHMPTPTPTPTHTCKRKQKHIYTKSDAACKINSVIHT